ncbi:MAG: hypothetical protein WCA63_00780 [Gallionella sp.]
MKKIISLAILGFLIAMPAFAAERQVSLDSNELFALSQYIGMLNGQTVLDKDKKSVTIPYDFSAAATIALAKDLRIINTELTNYRAAVKAKTTGNKEADVKMANDLAAVKRDVILETFTTLDLRLDENHVSPALLSGIWMLLDDQMAPLPKASKPPAKK